MRKEASLVINRQTPQWLYTVEGKSYELELWSQSGLLTMRLGSFRRICQWQVPQYQSFRYPLPETDDRGHGPEVLRAGFWNRTIDY